MTFQFVSSSISGSSVVPGRIILIDTTGGAVTVTFDENTSNGGDWIFRWYKGDSPATLAFSDDWTLDESASNVSLSRGVAVHVQVNDNFDLYYVTSNPPFVGA